LGNIRRTNIPLAGNVSHTINLQQNASNALRLIGHVAYYGTSGVGIMRAANGGWGACSYATGNASSGTNPGGGMGNTTSGNSLTTDHIQPWSGTYTFQVNNACTGFPFQPDLMILGLGPNDATDGSPPGMVRSAMERFINAARRGVPASSSTQLGASILILADPVPSMYGDSTLGGPLYAWHRYKELMRSIAQDYGCAYLDIGEVFGETSQTRGLIANSGQLGHPTQSNGASLGTDGHSLITQVVSGIL
jgi:lysophospholipase L1-like esterase